MSNYEWMRQIYSDIRQHSRRAAAKHQHTARQIQGFIDIVRDQKCSETLTLPELDQPACKAMRVRPSRLASGSSSNMTDGSFTRARASAARCAMPPES